MAVFHSVIKPLYLSFSAAASVSLARVHSRELFYQINFFLLAQIFPDERFDGLKVEIKVPGPALLPGGASALSSDKLLLRFARNPIVARRPSIRALPNVESFFRAGRKSADDNNGVKFQGAFGDFLRRGVHREIFSPFSATNGCPWLSDFGQM